MTRPSTAKSKAKVSPRMGRPPKGEAPAARLMSVRWTDADRALLDALVASERARLEAAGIMPDTAARVAAADVLRALVRQEAERRGLSSAA